MCRSRPWEQHVTVTKPQEDFWEWPLTLGPDNKDLLLTSKGLVLSVGIKPQIICLVIISPCRGDCLPFYPTKVQMLQTTLLWFPDAEAQELCGRTSQHKFREAEGSNSNLILSSLCLKQFCGSLLPSGTMANPFPWFTRPAYLAFCLLLPQCLTQ